MPSRRKRNLLDNVLSRSSGAYCVLDGEKRIRFCSPGVEELTGWPSAQLENLICDPSAAPTAEPVELLVAALAPSPEVMAGIPQTVDVMLPQHNNKGIQTCITFLPVSDEDGAVGRVIVFIAASPHQHRGTSSLIQKLHAEITSLRLEFRRRFSEASFIGRHPTIHRALAQAELLSHTDCGYSITGPSGSGRRHLARLIHVTGRSQEESLVSLECRLLTAEQVLDTLRLLQRTRPLDSGAPHERVGTLLLVDAELCPREVQTWILDDLKMERAGVRLVAICTESLDDAVAAGWVLDDFRDLFGTLQIKLPSLHHRGDDISLLAQHFIEECRRTLETSAEGMSEAVEEELRFYRWPGNVRELRRVIAEACQNSFAEQLTPEDFSFTFRTGQDAQELAGQPEQPVSSLAELMQRFETDVIVRTLSNCGGNKAEAARRLGMTRPRLYRRLKTLGLDSEDDEFVHGDGATN